MTRNADFASRPPLVDVVGGFLCLALIYWLSRSLGTARNMEEYCRSSRVYYVHRRRRRQEQARRDTVEQADRTLLSGGAAAV